MISFKKINLNRPYHFFSDIINIKNVDPNLLTIDKIPFKNTDGFVYNIKYIMKQSIDNKNIDGQNTLCLFFNNVDPYIIEESGNKYLIFALKKKNKKVLEIYRKLWNKIKNRIKAINSGESVKYKKDMKIRQNLFMRQNLIYLTSIFLRT